MSIEVVAEKPPRKFPAPCWSQDETLALIDAYRDRWYALRRGYLRTADWDAVAAAVTAKCPGASPAKTSAQCRHKMEKLRQRYRAEKQRFAAPVPGGGRFFSSWFFFDNMDAMETGGSGGSGSGSGLGSNPEMGNYSSVFRIKNVGDRNLVEQVMKPKNSKIISSGFLSQNLGSDPNSVTVGVSGKSFSPNYGPNSSYMEEDSDEDDVDEVDYGSGVHIRVPFNESLMTPVMKAKKMGKMRGNYVANYGVINPYHANDLDNGGSFYAQHAVDHDMLPSGFRMRSSGKVKSKMNPNLVYMDGGFGGNARTKGSVKCEINSDGFNGVPSGYGYGADKKSGERGVKRERGAIDEMVSSIRLLGEGFVKMEKMKMDMAREFEKNRMEMELKRNQLILESQRKIVDAFVSALLGNNDNVNDKRADENPSVLLGNTDTKKNEIASALLGNSDEKKNENPSMLLGDNDTKKNEIASALLGNSAKEKNENPSVLLGDNDMKNSVIASALLGNIDEKKNEKLSVLLGDSDKKSDNPSELLGNNDMKIDNSIVLLACSDTKKNENPSDLLGNDFDQEKNENPTLLGNKNEEKNGNPTATVVPESS